MPEAGERGRCKVLVSFNILRLPETMDVLQSSGYQDLDAYTVRWVQAHWEGQPRTSVRGTCVYDEP